MSLTLVLPYFRECLCDLNFEEWKTELDSDNPPSTIIERAFRLEIGNIIIQPARHTTFNFSFPVELNLYFKTYLDPVEGMDCALRTTEEVLCCLLAAEKRYGSDLKSISPTSIIYEALADTNDNVIKAIIDFDINLEIEYRDRLPE